MNTSPPVPTLRRLASAVIVVVVSGMGCALLVPYPGGEDPVEVFSPLNAPGFPGGEDPLVNPETDASVTVDSELEVAVAIPGSAFPIFLNFDAPNENVIGGGIRFPGSDEVQWTFVDGVNGEAMGQLRFGYVIADEACEDVANLCHEIMTEQFAVTDVGGQFHVSNPVEVPIVLQCATCDSLSCVEVLPPGECKTCAQPDACVEVYETCFAPGQPGEAQSSTFDVFLGENGALWSSADACAQGEALCTGLLEAGSCEL